MDAEMKKRPDTSHKCVLTLRFFHGLVLSCSVWMSEIATWLRPGHNGQQMLARTDLS